MIKNSVRLIGNVGQDPEMITTDSGRQLARFSVATNESYRKGEEKVETTHWHDLIAWGKTAELCGELLKKGSHVAITGKLTYSTYEKDGVSIKRAQVQVTEFQVLDRKQAEEE